MNVSTITSSELANKIYVIAEKTSQIVVQYLGKAYQWLSVNIPVAMNLAYDLAQKTMIATKPHLATLGTWAIENKDLLSSSTIGAVAGFTLAYLIFARTRKAA